MNICVEHNPFGIAYVLLQPEIYKKNSSKFAKKSFENDYLFSLECLCWSVFQD